MNLLRKPSGCAARLLSVAVILIGLACLLGAALWLNQQAGLRRARAAFPPPGRLVTVNGLPMHLNCQGRGAPTVVIDAGNGSFSLEWTPIQQALAQHLRVCTFDRPGYGWSAPSPARRDGLQAAAELYGLLHAAGEAGPYLLVGHSLGGVHVRIFAAQHPAETAGLVLVDTAQPLEVGPALEAQMQASIGFYQVMRLLAGSGALRLLGPLGGESALPETARGLPPALQDAYLNLLLDPAQYTAAIAEMEQLPRTLAAARELLDGQPSGGKPVIVLTAGQTAAPGATPFDPRRIPRAQEEIAAQAQMTALSTAGEQRIIAESGHAMHIDAPQAVIQAVLDAAEQAYPAALR